MTAVILTIHVLIVLALIGVVLLQRSDGGALGIGGGSGGGFMTGRGAANALTRTTSILAAAFFATSLILAIRAGAGSDDSIAIEELTGQQAPVEQTEPAAATTDDILNSLGGGDASGAATPSEADILDSLGANDALPLPEAPADTESASEDAPTAETEEPETSDTPNL